MDSDWEAKNSSPEERNPKRRMKTPFQLEALERVYAEDRYPTEAVRAELSLHLNLSDKQLQMWFCHRRLKDRKGKDGGTLGGPKQQATDGPKGLSAVGSGSEVQVTSRRAGPHMYIDEFGFEEHYGGTARCPPSPRRKIGGLETDTVPSERTEFVVSKDLDPRTAAGTVVPVLSQLGESARDDGPVVGIDFDPLPPGAFGSLGDPKPQRRVTISPHRQHKESRPVGQETRQRKAGGFGLAPLPATGMKQKAVGLPGQQYVNTEDLTTAPREFQFLPEEPSVREDTNHGQLQLSLEPTPERCYQLHLPQRSILASNLPIGSGDGCRFHQESTDSAAICLFLQGESRVSYAANGLSLGELEQEGLRHGFQIEGQVGVHQSVLQSTGTNQPFVYSEGLPLFQEHEHARMEKKRKCEEMKAAKESEAHVKRIRKDLERQEIVRRKREDQMRRELEKLDREKRKDEDRANKERQREEERLQREHRRELERQEKILLKENKKIEKQQRKEEMRKAKEAARLKAASERAAAKRTSKETADTVEDEQLEFLWGTTAKGLFIANGLEDRNCQTMDAYKVPLKKFPPATVTFKEPFSCGPWNELERAVGHLLMVWRFLTTFADVLGLWCFTLDEFAQALHDFDPRLLSEIHISLITMIVKNIEDAAQSAGSVVAGSQNSVTLASGGHPQIVDMAHEWGFDIQDWGRQMNPRTWPEILRQFGLAAGYGPKWRTGNTETSQAIGDCEDHPDEGNAVTILRSGAAAASAVAVMQGKGVGVIRKCRHRLTPGTVKYAAFHILSLEGGTGLTILEVAEKIQKSGLRDLTTSKTPEASIAAALSRDTNLFERVAPSTYSVRCAFRKDVEDTEEVLQSARERIRLFQSGFLDVEDTEKETDEAEEVERDGAYDSDGQDVEEGDVGPFMVKGSDMKSGNQAETLDIFENLRDQEMEIDDSQLGEPWVQGLTEGEYSDLSIEERLMALVALVNVVNEGNSIRQALEVRMEAASAVKRQIWAEAQIERRRHKEEQLSRPPLFPLTANIEGGEVSVVLDVGSNPISTLARPNEAILRNDSDTTLEVNSVLNESISAPELLSTSEANFSSHEKGYTIHEKSCPFQEGLIPQDNVAAAGHAIEKSRTHLKPRNGNYAEELYAVRSLPLGLDRRRNRYWQFVACTGGQDPNEGRIYFENSSDGHWGVIDNEEALDALMMSLDTRGTREAALHAALVRLEDPLKMAMRNAATSRHEERTLGFDALLGSTNTTTDFSIIRADGSSGIRQEESPRFCRFRLEDIGAIVVNQGQTSPGKQHLYERLKEFEHWIWSEHSWVRSAWRVKFGRKESDLLFSCLKCRDLHWATDKRCQSCSSALAKMPMKQDLHTRECDEKMKNTPSRTSCEPLTAIPPRIQILKADIIALEVVVPPAAFQDSWDHEHRKAWASSLKNASSTTELFQSLAELERWVKLDWLSSLHATTEAFCDSKLGSLKAAIRDASWVPCTSAAISLRVMTFDASLAYISDEKQRFRQQEDDHCNLIRPSMSMSASRTASDFVAADDQVNEKEIDILRDVIGSRGRGRSRGGPKTRAVHSSRTNKARLGVKKGSNSKLQFDNEGIVPTKANIIPGGKVGGRGQGRSRGRARGRSTAGRARGRGSRRRAQNQLYVHSVGKVHKHKNMNVPGTKMQRSQFEESAEIEYEPEVQPASDGDGASKGECGEMKDPLEMGGNGEYRGDIEEDEEEDEVLAEDPEEEDQGVDGAKDGQIGDRFNDIDEGKQIEEAGVGREVGEDGDSEEDSEDEDEDVKFDESVRDTMIKIGTSFYKQ